MCTMIAEQAAITGSGKGTQGWIKVNKVNVSYDHPTHMTIEHALNIDFVNESQGSGCSCGGGTDERVGEAAGGTDRGGAGERCRGGRAGGSVWRDDDLA